MDWEWGGQRDGRPGNAGDHGQVRRLKVRRLKVRRLRAGRVAVAGAGWRGVGWRALAGGESGRGLCISNPWILVPG